MGGCERDITALTQHCLHCQLSKLAGDYGSGHLKDITSQGPRGGSRAADKCCTTRIQQARADNPGTARAELPESLRAGPAGPAVASIVHSDIFGQQLRKQESFHHSASLEGCSGSS